MNLNDLGTIYLVGDDGDLVSLTETPYDSEDLLQRLLARYPSLLAGEQVNPSEPRRWMLVQREAGIPGEEGGVNRWSVDHLFLDQGGVPTLVEVKRSRDTRIRREVVGQMLDYAANALGHWPLDTVRTLFERAADARGEAVGDVLAAAGIDDEEEFWRGVKTNLQAGRVRLVFVADRIPTELARVIEFLNEQMDPAEVIGIEVRQFVGAGRQTLVPRVIGQTAQAQQKKSTSSAPKRQWDEATFFDELRERRGETAVTVARKILDWSVAQGLRIWWGQGSTNGSFFPMLEADGQSHSFASIWTSGTFEIQFQHMSRGPFADDSRRRELRDRLVEIPGVEIPDDKLTRRPNIPLEVLEPAASMEAFLGVWGWYLDSLRAADAR